ncbi:energy-coupling factor transport system substrate-specific component [Arthrobacter pigmenti]|uniref:Energy-coupling factor transport system substrate-specific component n=1 Tax=Arthrobacter pigmenti TaxID=271432 RepID=A0A846RSQ1_9MICC|nr:ECF transporter S component [Arthrobacter pigmenti]NJC23504.1 energy-coupling factor transport system substrate-specific component [Arthrobacter pigmenti]
MTTAQSSKSSSTSRRRYEWRVVDIVVASVIAVAVGVVFFAWSAGYSGISALTLAYPPLNGLYSGGWLIAGVLGGLIIRKPGAAIYCEVVAAAVSALIGTQFGVAVLLSGLIQGIGAELIFALFLYKRWNIGVALLAGLSAGLFLAVSENIMYNSVWTLDHKLMYGVFAAISGVVLAGLLPWLATRGLAKTGVLSSFASGRTADV